MAQCLPDVYYIKFFTDIVVKKKKKEYCISGEINISKIKTRI